MKSSNCLKIVFVLSISTLSCSKNAFQVEDLQPVEQSKFVTFKKDIKPLFSTRCAPCHTAGGDRVNKWDDYNTTKSLITGIIGRVKKESNDILFMPKNGVKLNKEEMALLNKWIEDGVLEK